MKDSAGIKIVHSLSAADLQATGPTNGAAADCLGFDEMTVILNVGVLTGAATLDIHLEESADNVTFADITSAVFSQKLATTDVQGYQATVELRGRKRYIRAVAEGDNANAALASVSLALHGATERPITPENTLGFRV